MKAGLKGLEVLAIGAVAVALGVIRAGGDGPTRVSEVAEPRVLPPGAPKYSDVSLSSRTPHPRKANDPYDTFEAARAFHATRLDWVNTDDADFVRRIHEEGLSYISLNVGANDQTDPNGETYLIGRAESPKGERLITPWLAHKAVPRVFGCPNKPDWRERVWKPHVKKNLDAGADGIQHAGAGYGAVTHGGCYCDYCVAGFRDFLKTRAEAAQLKEWNITEIDTFNFREYVLSVGGGEHLGKGKPYKGVPADLHEMFMQFQESSTERFHREMREWMNEYAGRHVPYSCNNGSGQSWDHHFLPFDFGYSELMTKTAHPEHLWARMVAARELGKAQTVSAPKPEEPVDPQVYRRLTRKVIATTYACGGHTSVPWDVAMPGEMGRYFGRPEEYADLYGFVRANARYLDGYEDAAAIGPGIVDERSGARPPVIIEDGSGGVYAFVRARPGDAEAPVVIHLVDWGRRKSEKRNERWMRGEPKSFALKLRTASFFEGAALSVELLIPPNYDKATHEKADSRAERMREKGQRRGAWQAQAYASLSESVEVESTVKGEFTIVQVPALNPWGMLIVSKELAMARWDTRKR